MHPKILTAMAAIVCAMATQPLYAADLLPETTTLGAKVFIDFTRVDFANDGVKQPPSGIGLDIKRGYLSFVHTFDDIWSANVTTDFNYVSADSETQLFIKKAYLQAKLSDAFFARLGAADMPWILFIEESYGYRYVEKLVVDRAGYGTTGDWGLHVGGKFADGIVNYAVSGVNGNGFRNPTRSRSMDVEGRIGVTPIKGLLIAAGFYNGKLGLDTEGLTTAQQPRGAERWDAFVGYSRPEFRVGAEYFIATDWKITNAAASDKADGYSLWGAYNFTTQISAFARYDAVKPSKDVSPAKKDKYFNTGIAYKPRKNVELAFAYKHEKVDNGSFKIAEVTLGTNTSLESTYSEVGFWTQVSF